MTAPTNCLACERCRVVDAAGRRQAVLCRTDTGLVVVTSFGWGLNPQFQVVTPGDECPRMDE